MPIVVLLLTVVPALSLCITLILRMANKATTYRTSTSTDSCALQGSAALMPCDGSHARAHKAAHGGTHGGIGTSTGHRADGD